MAASHLAAQEAKQLQAARAFLEHLPKTPERLKAQYLIERVLFSAGPKPKGSPRISPDDEHYYPEFEGFREELEGAGL
jgi:hypothetical protein